MRNWKLVIPAVIVMSGFLFCTTASFGKPEYQKKENLKSCTACHVKVGAPDAMKKDPNLNDLGTCYSKNNHSLANCKVPDGVKKS
jgi:cytochrome c553